MNVNIIGKGNVGGALARRAAEVGHVVTLTDSTTEAAQAADLAAAADLVVLALPFPAVAALDAKIKHALAGRVVADATNPLAADFMSLTVGYTTSGGEEVAKALPGAKVVKAFGNVLAPQHSTPEPTPGNKLFVPVAGDDAASKAIVADFAVSLGFDAVDAGPLANARYIEPVTELLIQLAYGQGLGAGVGLALTRA